MKTIFTIHAGEYLVGSELERQFPLWNIWLPSRDTGIDLLMTDKNNETTISIQVKFSKSWTETHTREEFRQHFRTQGWWNLNREKIENSNAKYWIFALYSFDIRKNDFIIIKPDELINLYNNLGAKDNKTIHSYIWTTEQGNAYEGRSLGINQIRGLINGEYDNNIRNLTQYLNKWERMIEE